MSSAPKEMSILDHIRELRKYILISMVAFAVAVVVCFFFSSYIIKLFTKPFSDVDSMVATTMVISNITEGFLAQLRISAIAGLILSMPIHIFGIIRFIFPGLKSREKRVVLSFLVVSLVFIVVGAYFVYFLLVPIVIDF